MEYVSHSARPKGRALRIYCMHVACRLTSDTHENPRVRPVPYRGVLLLGHLREISIEEGLSFFLCISIRRQHISNATVR